jgi:hypothetical protein
MIRAALRLHTSRCILKVKEKARTRPPWRPSRRHRQQPGRPPHACSSPVPEDAPTALRRLADAFGIQLVPGLEVAPSALCGGLGLFFSAASAPPAAAAVEAGVTPAAPQQQHQQQHHHHHQGPARPLIRVPLDLVLSATIPGAAPAARAAPELRGLLSDPEASWELQLAGLLLWASSSSGGSSSSTTASSSSAVGDDPQAASTDSRNDCRARRFWRQYARFIPPADEQTSLSLWDEDELAELQDARLAAAARRWQSEVAAVHRGHFGGGSSGSSSSGGGAAGGGGWPPSLQEWRWAVASIESRAFGVMVSGCGGSRVAQFRSAVYKLTFSCTILSAPSITTHEKPHNHKLAKVDGQELRAAVPFFDIANHQAKAPTTHGLAYSSTSISGSDSTTTTTTTSSSSSGGGITNGAGEPAPAFFELSSDAACTAGQELLTTYGKKDNARLLEQYGFVLPGNPFDRLDFAGLEAPTGADGSELRVSRDAVAAAAAAECAELERSDSSRATTTISSDDEQQRVLAAAASLVGRMGWRGLREFQGVSPESTAACAAVAGSCLAHQLAAAPTTAEEDGVILRELLQGGDGDGGGTGRRRRVAAAVRLRLERKLLGQAGQRLCLRILRDVGASIDAQPL